MVGGCSSVSGATFPFERSVNCEKCVSERAVRWDKINHFEGKENTKYREMVTRKYDNCVFCESLFKLRFINMKRCVHTMTLYVSMKDVWHVLHKSQFVSHMDGHPTYRSHALHKLISLSFMWVFYMLMIDHFKVFCLCFSSQCFCHLGCHKLS